jgi:deazaflavin-dependent oxidoreductase (nitroreductase family)
VEPAYLYLTSTGRRTGQPREIEIWFTTRDARYYLIAEHRERAGWVRNVQAEPRVRWRVGERALAGRARVVDPAAEPDLQAVVRAASEAKYGWGDGLVVELTPEGSMTDEAGRAEAVAAHYGRTDLEAAILDGLRRAGKDPEALAPADLAAVDQFHTRGRDATLELARRAGVGAGQRVLDVGGGLGGPARTLAAELACDVTVVDLTESYCRVGEDLTRRTGLADRVRFRHGDALALPFEAGVFDVVWTQHSSMNVGDKPRLYGELGRVLRPGGRLALHEILGGPAPEPLVFPVPWARDPAWSFLLPAAEVRALIAGLGFREVAWEDGTPAALAWFRQRVAALRAAPAPPPLGLHLLLGPDYRAMFENQVRNLETGRIAVVQAVFERAAGSP